MRKVYDVLTLLGKDIEYKPETIWFTAGPTVVFRAIFCAYYRHLLSVKAAYFTKEAKSKQLARFSRVVYT